MNSFFQVLSFVFFYISSMSWDSNPVVVDNSNSAEQLKSTNVTDVMDTTHINETASPTPLVPEQVEVTIPPTSTISQESEEIVDFTVTIESQTIEEVYESESSQFETEEETKQESIEESQIPTATETILITESEELQSFVDVEKSVSPSISIEIPRETEEESMLSPEQITPTSEGNEAQEERETVADEELTKLEIETEEVIEPEPTTPVNEDEPKTKIENISIDAADFINRVKLMLNSVIPEKLREELLHMELIANYTHNKQTGCVRETTITIASSSFKQRYFIPTFLLFNYKEETASDFKVLIKSIGTSEIYIEPYTRIRKGFIGSKVVSFPIDNSPKQIIITFYSDATDRPFDLPDVFLFGKTQKDL